MTLNKKYLTVGDLKEIIKNFPDNMRILVPLDVGHFETQFVGATKIDVIDETLLEIL